MPIKEIMTSQELDQHSKIQTTKAKGCILLKKGQRHLHKGIINNNSFTLELVTKSGYYNQFGDGPVFFSHQDLTTVPVTACVVLQNVFSIVRLICLPLHSMHRNCISPSVLMSEHFFFIQSD